MDYLYTRYFAEGSSKNYSTYDELESLLRLKSDDIEQAKLGLGIKNIVDCIDKNSNCNVKGSKELVELYNSLDGKKMDLKLPLSEIEFVGFYHDNQIILKLDNTNYIGVYSFTSHFLDSLFSLKQFSSFCFAHNEKDLLIDNIKKLMVTQKDEIKQYRFLIDGEKTFLRALTSKSYKNYDNNLAIYLALQSLNKYAEEHKVNLFVENAYITDSNLDVIFKQENDIEIDKDTFANIGIRLTNNEITEGKLSMQFIYTISDNKNNKFQAIGDSVVGITHSNTATTIENKLDDLNKLSEYSDNMIQHIKSIKNRKKLDRDQLSLIFNKLLKANITSGSKERIDNIYKNEVIGNTYSLVELFGKISSIETTIDEKMFIQVVFNELILNKIAR